MKVKNTSYIPLYVKGVSIGVGEEKEIEMTEAELKKHETLSKRLTVIKDKKTKE